MNERLLAYYILLNFEKKADRLDDLLAETYKKNSLNSHQRRYIKNVTSGVLRFRSELDFFIRELFHGEFSKLIREVKIILRLALYELKFVKNIPEYSTVDEYVKVTKKKLSEKSASLTNAVLRNFLRRKKEIETIHKKSGLTDKYSFPKWLIDNWVKRWGKQFTEQMCGAFNDPPTFDLRLNNLKISESDFEKILIENEIEYKKGKLPGFFSTAQISKVVETGILEKGFCTVQDESAALPLLLWQLKNTDTLLDVCAAPGGKFTQAIENCPQLKLAIAIDENVARLKKVKENLKRLDQKGYLVAADARHLPFTIKFSKILIDAPCTGLGVIIKHPDIKWRRNEKEILEFSQLQEKILTHGSQYLEKEGSLIYATCSIDPRENEEVINSFLANHPEYEVSGDSFMQQKIPFGRNDHGFIRTFPHTDLTDGSFVCLLRYKSFK
jgi:16S rRNA (cytosine967-C5)-methyltransferase